MFEQTTALSQNLVKLIGSQTGGDLIDTAESTQLVYGWRGSELVVRQGAFNLKPPTESGTYVEEMGGVKWVLSSSCIDGNCVVVGFRDLERKYLVRRLVVGIFTALLLMLSLAMVAMYYAVSSGLKPLDRLADELADTDVSKLKPIVGHDSARELRPLVSALNQLMENMRNQLHKERHFLDTCTHELRTPVAGLVAQIQSLSKHEAQHPRFQTIKQAAHRTVRVANQFLSLAKNNNAQALASSAEPFDLTELVRQLSAEALLQYEQVTCQLNGESQLVVDADPLAMEMVVRNLLENACRYGKTRGADTVAISIDLALVGKAVRLTVEDAGEGVDQQYFTQLTQRFFRTPGVCSEQTHSQGAGLGLSIVEEVASRYAGQVTIGHSETLGGLRVTVDFVGIANIEAEEPVAKPATAAGPGLMVLENA